MNIESESIFTPKVILIIISNIINIVIIATIVIPVISPDMIVKSAIITL